MVHELKMAGKDVMYEKTGDFNQLPPGWKEITEAEFAQSDFFSYTPDAVEFRQAPLKKGEPPASLHLYWMHGRPEGFCIVGDYWKKTVRFFQFGCDHKWEEVSVATLEKLFPERKGKFSSGRCFHNYVCHKCRAHTAVDSSD